LIWTIKAKNKSVVFLNAEMSSESSRYREVGKLLIDLQDQLGEGGEGTIFKGKYNSNDIAVKRTKSSYEEDILAKVDSHPNILRFYCKEKDKDYT